MGKVVTSEGLVAFVTEGKSTHVENHKPGKPGEAPPLEVKTEAKTTELGDGKQTSDVERSGAGAKDSGAEGSKDSQGDPNEGLEPDEHDIPEKARKAVNRKHREMKAAQALADKRREEVEELERLAEGQYNERKLAERRAEDAERRAAELESRIQQPKAAEAELKAPTPDDKDADGKYLYRDAQGQLDWDKYTDAKADFAAQKAVAGERKRQADERAAEEQQRAETAMKARADAARKVHPDFDEVMSSVKGTEADQVPQYVLNYLFESENAGLVAYHLAKNKDDAARISKLKPILGIAELGKLEASLTKPAAATAVNTAPVVRPERGGAPAPITPLTGEGVSGIQTDPSKMDFKQLRAYERERARKRH